MSGQSERFTGIAGWLADRASVVIAAAIAATLVLAIPFLTMQPEESASQEPAGEIFAARDKIEDNFASSVFTTFMIVEDRSGDMLRVEPLLELLAAEEAVRADAEISKTLFGFFDATDEVQVVGVRSVADRINDAIPGGLAGATDLEAKQAAAALIASRGIAELGLSAQMTTDADGLPVSPALFVPVLSDDTLLGFGGVGVRLGSGTESEEYSRDILALIRGDEASYQAWGVAIDVNLTSNEQGEAAGPFIGLTILAVLLIVGLTFRSYWVLAVTGASLSALIIWLQGITNLIGFKDDLLLTLIVPIAMISFGVDSTFHAVGRYREVQGEGKPPRAAFRLGLGAVAAALVLALASDAAAFISNVGAGIESVVQFGLGAAIALGSAFVLLGVITPLVIMKIEDRVGFPAPNRRRSILTVTASIVAGLVAMVSVLLSVFILPIGGVIALVVYVVLFLALPYWRSTQADEDALVLRSADTKGSGRASHAIGSAMVSVARRGRIVLPVIAVITVGAVFFALKTPTEFDVKDFFAADTDFVVALDKLDLHGGDQAGEPAQILVEADLTDPIAVEAVADFISRVEAIDSPGLGKDDDGQTFVQGGLSFVLDEVWGSPFAIAAIAETTGVALTDDNGDQIPDTREQLAALYEFTRESGVPFDPMNLVLTPDNVRAQLSAEHHTRLLVAIPGSREVDNIMRARNDLEPAVADLEAALQSIEPGASAILSGSPIARQESLDAISRTLQISLLIAVGFCLIIASLFMRSVRYGFVSIIPILIVVSWLYAFMYLFGFSINLVTATIGAVSIGIGIDFATHFAMRYREELAATGSQLEAVRISGEGTGVALTASAMSSIVGFAILAFAPMPLFASYGLLTAVMIAMALFASLLVLPSLLILVTKDHAAA